MHKPEVFSNRKEGVQRTISNSTEESIIKWFKEEQFPLRAGYLKTTDTIAPWFHGESWEFPPQPKCLRSFFLLTQAGLVSKAPIVESTYNCNTILCHNTATVLSSSPHFSFIVGQVWNSWQRAVGHGLLLAMVALLFLGFWAKKQWEGWKCHGLVLEQISCENCSVESCTNTFLPSVSCFGFEQVS